MSLRTFTQLLVLSLATRLSAASHCDGMRAFVYRGPTACEECPESLRDLLKLSCPGMKVTFAGPDELVKINNESLSQVHLLAQPGGPDLDQAWREAKSYAPTVRDFVAGGGQYLGVCLGAFLAGHKTGFGMVPKGGDTVREILRPRAPVDDESDTVVQIDWTFSAGSKRGTTESRRWMCFQDGTAFRLSRRSPTTVVGRYSKNGDVAAMINFFGGGWVASIGTHPEADSTWYDEAEIENSEGIGSDIGQDLVQALLHAS